MNIFEGARRIAKIIYFLIVAGGVLIAFGTNPYLSRYYKFDENFDLVSVETCGTTSWFVAKVEGRPDWASISVCGGLEGPKTMPLNQAELQKLDEEIQEKKIGHYSGIVIGTTLTLLSAMILFWSIGWIVRGFMGIQRGVDAK